MDLGGGRWRDGRVRTDIVHCAAPIAAPTILSYASIAVEFPLGDEAGERAARADLITCHPRAGPQEGPADARTCQVRCAPYMMLHELTLLISSSLLEPNQWKSNAVLLDKRTVARQQRVPPNLAIGASPPSQVRSTRARRRSGKFSNLPLSTLSHLSVRRRSSPIASTMTSATQGPIPIARGGDGIDKTTSDSSVSARPGGSAGSYLGLSGSLGGSSSFRESMALSFGKDVAEYVYCADH